LVARRIDDDIRPLLDAEQLRRYERLGEVRQRIRERWKSGERLTAEQREWLRERIEQRYGKRARD
jgi:Spy/CpxP family protein refolding chaperone